MELTPMTSAILTFLGGILASSGFWAFMQEKQKRKDSGQKRTTDETQMLVGLAHDRIIFLCMTYIERGWITQDEYENLYDYLYKPYENLYDHLPQSCEKLERDGSVKRVMAEVNKLPIRKA